MRTSRIAGLIAIGAISLPLLAGPASATDARLRSTPPIGRQLAELKGSDTIADNGFGVSVAISGTTAVVGAPGYAKSAGRAYVFTKTGALWNQVAELKGSDTVAGDYLGYSVAISGTTIAVGAPGHSKDAGQAYVFTKTGAVWNQAAELKGSDTVAADYFGYSVVISGTTAVVGSPGYAKTAGRVYVFTKTGTAWKQAAELKGSDTVADSGFGYSVAVSGTTAVVGAPVYTKNAGRAYVFINTAGGWKQVAELKGSDTVGDDGFGTSVAISGTTALVGADGHAKEAGRAYVFTNTAGGWEQAAELKGSDTVAGDGFGISVVMSGSTAIAGAPDHAKVSGRAYVFANTAGGWKQATELKGSDTVAADGFGVSVAISGTDAVVGAPGYAKSAGRAYVLVA
jgi:nucleoside-specific outer membrane channel protein Tsx